MSSALSLPEFQKLGDAELQELHAKLRLTSHVVDLFRALMVAASTVGRLADPNSSERSGIDLTRQSVAKAHLAKIVSIGRAVMMLQTTGKNREALQSLCHQIFITSLQAIWLLEADSIRLKEYFVWSYRLELSRYFQRGREDSNLGKSMLEHIEHVIEQYKISSDDLSSTTRFNDIHEIIDELNLDPYYPLLLEISMSSDFNSHASMQDLISFSGLEPIIGELNGAIGAIRISMALKPVTQLMLRISASLSIPEIIKEDLQNYFHEFALTVDAVFEFMRENPPGDSDAVGKTKDKLKMAEPSTGPITSRLKDHSMSNKKLTPPLLKLRSVTPQSWTNDRLPEYLWIALLIYGMGREKGIANLKLLIRDLLNVGLSTGACSFTSISKLALGEQETFVSVLLEDPERARCLAPIGILENFPGADVWKRHLHAISDIEQAWNDMAFAVGHVLFHQSQEATDVRWFVSAYHIASGRCILPTREMAEEFFKYPNHGDQRSVRPSIRAFEMMIPVDSDAKPLDNSTTEWARSFWTQMSDKTNCLIPNRGIPREPVKHFKLSSKKLWRSLSELQDSYISGRLTTAVDAKSDSIYGMTLFALQLGLEILDEPSRLSSVIVLRTITEIIINLKFLLESKESDIWTRYREYGVGQAKLVTLKMRELSEVPEYIPAEELEKIANEDRWEEFNQINVGDWTSANLRTRSEIVGLKDLYDKYFVWPSSITHAHWGAVRYASFTTCMNPVHRAHRVPEVNYHLKTVKYDLEILLLQVQGLFNSAFPDRSIDVFAELEAESPDL